MMNVFYLFDAWCLSKYLSSCDANLWDLVGDLGTQDLLEDLGANIQNRYKNDLRELYQYDPNQK